MTVLSAGRLNQRVTLQAKAVTRDGMGNEVISWSDVAAVWAAVEPVRGKEFVSLRAAQSDITTRITLRYKSGLTTAMRVLHDGAIYDVREIINPRSRNESLELMCVAAAVAS